MRLISVCFMWFAVGLFWGSLWTEPSYAGLLTPMLGGLQTMLAVWLTVREGMRMKS